MLERPLDTVALPNGVRVPCLGFGTWQLPEGERLIEAVQTALELGYRHIDTAAIYGNEEGIGEAIRTSGVPRSEIFITDKVWNSDRGYDSTLKAYEKSLRKLGTDYIDLYVIHWPAAQGELITWQSMNLGTWRALERLYQDGCVRAIGVSNFMPHHLVPLLARAEITPMANTIEFHPGHTQFAALKFSRAHGMKILGWSPLGRGALADNALLSEMAASHGKTPAQVCLRWSLEHGVLPIPKSLSREHLDENRRIFDFKLTREEVSRIDAMPPTAFSGLDPDYVSF